MKCIICGQENTSSGTIANDEFTCYKCIRKDTYSKFMTYHRILKEALKKHDWGRVDFVCDKLKEF